MTTLVPQIKTVVTFGTFDLCHIGHINILERASKLGTKLIVGISSDQLNFVKKGKYPVFSEKDRLAIIKSLKFVDEVFLEESLELKADYLKKCGANILVMGDDWQGKFDYLKKELTDLIIVYLPRTPNISTTEIIEKLVTYVAK